MNRFTTPMLILAWLYGISIAPAGWATFFAAVLPPFSYLLIIAETF